LLHGAGRGWNAPYPRRSSGGAFELGAAKFGHPIKNTDAHLNLFRLIFEVARLELEPDDGLPTADFLFDAAALIVAGGRLPNHPTITFDFGNVSVPDARVLNCVRAQDCVLGWWDCDFNYRAEAVGQSLNRWLAIVCTIRKKLLNRPIDLIQQVRQGCWVANIIRGQIRADDLAADKIKTKVQLAPGPSFALSSMLFLKSFTLAKDL
jgi:hypothetical protein